MNDEAIREIACSNGDRPQYRAARHCTLKRSKFLTLDLRPGEAVKIIVRQGSVWTTMEGNAEDYVMGPDEQLLFRTAGRLVIEALRASDLTIVVDRARQEPAAQFTAV